MCTKTNPRNFRVVISFASVTLLVESATFQQQKIK
ncbi:Uncharacterized protein APZ42_018864 [Daphnia magna]|uniref:Uncharacterized protein n=1 Tax=Daphnia magna TaxID=35525 RepID=A0A164YV89_9CRUS|nr:Uncharacterized protein APZ42_018864 [Daphnia magna]